LPDEVLKPLEKRFGPVVRRMRSWNSDGTFGYESVAAFKRAAEALEDPDLPRASFHLNGMLEQARAVIDQIAAAYRERTSF